jgi:hypothetical protein
MTTADRSRGRAEAWCPARLGTLVTGNVLSGPEPGTPSRKPTPWGFTSCAWDPARAAAARDPAPETSGLETPAQAPGTSGPESQGPAPGQAETARVLVAAE